MTSPTPPQSELIQSVKEFRAKYQGFRAIVHINTVQDGTVEINAPADEIWQKRIRVSVDELTEKQIVTA